jgi:hypothetical protein
MNAEFFAALDALQTETGISKEYMLEKIETGLITAFKRDSSNSNVKVYLNKTLTYYKEEVRVMRIQSANTVFGLGEGHLV